jgi:DNA-binding NarL/FixJ family response regulator
MATHSFETRALDSYTPPLGADGGQTLAIVPAEQTLEDFVASKGWSCAKERRGDRPLSPRERQILTLIIDGKTRKEVAYDLDIAHSTVRVIYSRAMKKLGGHWQPGGRRT